MRFDVADEDGVPDDTNNDKTITIGADRSANDVFLLGDDPLRPEETGWQDTASGFSTTALGTGGFRDMGRPTGAFDGWPGPWSAG